MCIYIHVYIYTYKYLCKYVMYVNGWTKLLNETVWRVDETFKRNVASAAIRHAAACRSRAVFTCLTGKPSRVTV